MCVGRPEAVVILADGSGSRRSAVVAVAVVVVCCFLRRTRITIEEYRQCHGSSCSSSVV